ncbi:uncharacterized protein LOC126840820 [Adelges cooleyi]|uniref:uncharacterized protein LOC126840820 n=1 Tax=Adelges cooleyi TaxID=133065 RepID=UPI00217FA0BD|nr:uncharacterized protein LOC126840820 [Adelges cooleyi]
MKMSFKFIFITAIMANYSVKMASTTKSDEDRRKEKDDLESTIPKFQSDLRIGDTADLKTQIYRAYMDTYECSYMFSGQIYMRLIEGLLVNKGHLANVAQHVDLSFTKEAAQMIATLYNVEAMRNNFTKNVMWIVLMFAERVLVYMKGTRAKRKTVVSIHKSVSLFLEHYMASDDCVDYSKYNKLNVEVTGNLDDLPGLLSTLASKKTIIMQRLDTNAKKRNISTAGYEQFNLNTLGLNGLLSDTAVTKRESIYEIVKTTAGVEVNWYGVLLPLKKQYDLGTQANGITLSQQINALKTFNDKFILMVKVFITRLMLKYVMYVNCNTCETKMVDDIVELENYLDIQDDGDMQYKGFN